MKTTICPEEVEKFSAIASQWWDVKGKFRPLHLFNPIRIEYIRKIVSHHFKDKSIQDLKLLDIGCGGGLLSEPMARMGFQVTGIDASEKNIKTASVHAQQSGVQLDYRACLVENMGDDFKNYFDIILNMEVIEHVENPQFFLEQASHLLKPNGIMVVATLNRTLKSYAFAIVGAEYILRWLPVGTHEWQKFLKPAELQNMMPADMLHQGWQGFSFNPLSEKWSYTDDLAVNYAGYWVKNSIS